MDDEEDGATIPKRDLLVVVVVLAVAVVVVVFLLINTKDEFCSISRNKIHNENKDDNTKVFVP